MSAPIWWMLGRHGTPVDVRSDHARRGRSGRNGSAPRPRKRGASGKSYTSSLNRLSVSRGHQLDLIYRWSVGDLGCDDGWRGSGYSNDDDLIL